MVDVCVIRGAKLSTDHHLVVCVLRGLNHPRTRKRLRSRKTYRLKWELFADKKVRHTFASKVASLLREFLDFTEDVEAEWDVFKSAVITSAAARCGCKMSSEKRTALWNQEVKEAIRAKKTAFRAWLTNKSSKQLWLRYSAARKTAATIAKHLKKSHGKNLDKSWIQTTFIFCLICLLDTSTNKVFWQTIGRLCGKQTWVAIFIGDTNGVLLKHQKGILNCWREYFYQLLNPKTVQHLETTEEQFGEEIHLTEAEMSTTIKSLKAGKDADEDDIRPKMLKAMNNFGFFWLTRVFQVAWKTGEVPKQRQISGLLSIHKNGDKKKCTNYRGISFLNLFGKIYEKFLKKKCREIVHPQL